MAVAGREILERHPEAAADLAIELVDVADEAVRRQPLGQGRAVREGTVDLLGRGAQDAVEADGSGGHVGFLGG